MLAKIKVDVNYQWYRFQEKFWMSLAWMMPRTLVMWAATRLIAHASQGKWGAESVSELKAIDALKRWEDKNV